SPFEFGKANMLWDSEFPEVTLIACGALVHNALLAARTLFEEGIQVSVLNLHTIKPLDVKSVVREARRSGAVVTIEEHQIAGGMGSAVAEVLSMHEPVPIEFIGMHDEYGQSGETDELIAHYKMDAKSIQEAVQKVIKRK